MLNSTWIRGACSNSGNCKHTRFLQRYSHCSYSLSLGVELTLCWAWLSWLPTKAHWNTTLYAVTGRGAVQEINQLSTLAQTDKEMVLILVYMVCWLSCDGLIQAFFSFLFFIFLNEVPSSPPTITVYGGGTFSGQLPMTWEQRNSQRD